MENVTRDDDGSVSNNLFARRDFEHCARGGGQGNATNLPWISPEHSGRGGGGGISARVHPSIFLCELRFVYDNYCKMKINILILIIK